MKIRIVLTLALLFAVGLLMAQTPTVPNSGGDLTIQGCMTMSAAHFVLIQTDPGNTYQLEPVRNVALDRYLGQQVEITGREAVSLGSTSDLGRPGSASPVTLKVTSVKMIANRCVATAP